jgi:hypothetical protein
MRCLPKPHLEGRKVAESVMVADMDIVSLAVPWTRELCRGLSPSLSSLKDGSHHECISPDEEGRDDRRTPMTIQEAVTKATEGGYHIHAADGMETDYVGANSEYSVWTRKDNASSFIVPVAETFMDPHFWLALGRGLGWEQAVRTVHAVENGRPTIVTRAGQHWLSHWHHFIDHLAEGKTPEAFFDTLTSHQIRESQEQARKPRRPSVSRTTKRRRA